MSDGVATSYCIDQAAPMLIGHKNEMVWAVVAKCECKHAPCPHCILGIDHNANLAEAMMKWKDIVWDYNGSLTEPDAGYFIKLMAIQWIGAMQVTPFRSRKRQMCTKDVINPDSCSVGSLTGTRRMTGDELRGGREGHHQQQNIDNLIVVDNSTASRRCLMKLPKSEAGFQIANQHAKKQEDGRHGHGARSNEATKTLNRRPPGLASPRQCTVRAVWLLELDPRAEMLHIMDDVLCMQLEECWKRGLAATAMEQLEEHYFYDFENMCRYNARTRSRCRMRRMVEEQ
jgi:hypothetical protein